MNKTTTKKVRFVTKNTYIYHDRQVIQNKTAEDKMTLAEANVGEEYIVKDIEADDEELVAFLFSLGCYSGEPITVWCLLKMEDTILILI